MKQKELFRFFAKVWTAVVKFLRAQAAKRRPINSVYFGKFLPHSDATGLYAYLPASKFLADNALVYSEVDQFNLNPYSSQVGSHALITHQVPDRLATVSSSAIAAVCSSTKEVVRYVLGEIMAALPRLTAAHPNAHIKIDIGIGSLSIQNGSLRFENPKTEGPTPERKIENGGGVAMAVPLPASNALSVPQTYREIAMKRSLSPSKSAAQKVSQYRSLMNEKASSTHLSRVSVSTPQTRRVRWMAKRRPNNRGSRNWPSAINKYTRNCRSEGPPPISSGGTTPSTPLMNICRSGAGRAACPLTPRCRSSIDTRARSWGSGRPITR